MNPNDHIHCPKCNSTQVSANKKGFSGKKAVAGAVLTGGIGLLAGTIGSNKVIITCLNCGNQFKPGAKKINKSDTVVMPLWWAILIFIMGVGFLIFVLKFLV